VVVAIVKDCYPMETSPTLKQRIDLGFLRGLEVEIPQYLARGDVAHQIGIHYLPFWAMIHLSRKNVSLPMRLQQSIDRIPMSDTTTRQ